MAARLLTQLLGCVRVHSVVANVELLLQHRLVGVLRKLGRKLAFDGFGGIILSFGQDVFHVDGRNLYVFKQSVKPLIHHV